MPLRLYAYGDRRNLNRYVSAGQQQDQPSAINSALMGCAHSLPPMEDTKQHAVGASDEPHTIPLEAGLGYVPSHLPAAMLRPVLSAITEVSDGHERQSTASVSMRTVTVRP